MLIQWPDKFYHTSEDTLDKVDPAMLAATGGLATAYAYFIAAAGEAEARWLAREVVARGTALARLYQDSYTTAMEADSPHALAVIRQRAEKNLAFRADRTIAALRSLGRLARNLDGVIEENTQAVRAAHEEEWRRLARDLGPEPMVSDAAPDEWTLRAEQLVLRRRFRGPISDGDLSGRLSPDDRALMRELRKAHPHTARVLPVYMIYWIDGRRSLREIADLVECETGLRDVELMVQMAGVLQRAGLLERSVTVRGDKG